MYDFGFGENIKKLKSMNQADRENLYEVLKVFPGHRARFNTMLEMLRCILVEDADLSGVSRETKDNARERKSANTRPRTTTGGSRTFKVSEKTVRDSYNVTKKIRDLSCYRGGDKHSLNNLHNSSSKNLKRHRSQSKEQLMPINKRLEDMSAMSASEMMNELKTRGEIIENLETSNKHLNLELNKVRKELELHKLKLKQLEALNCKQNDSVNSTRNQTFEVEIDEIKLMAEKEKELNFNSRHSKKEVSRIPRKKNSSARDSATQNASGKDQNIVSKSMNKIDQVIKKAKGILPEKSLNTLKDSHTSTGVSLSNNSHTGQRPNTSNSLNNGKNKTISLSTRNKNLQKNQSSQDISNKENN
mmetsp:Transcript_92557/g.200060  ORF Transcript_92557/g.200060 Transcript_92557/m.200060 type:complete len:359 (+) Transcript_92557:178-1254(+)